METISQKTSSAYAARAAPMWIYLFRVANIFLSLLVLIVLLTGESIGRLE